MFSESAWSRKTIGDVDVVWHEGLYHLFHLVLPNHDFIAHAISDNGLNWRRIDNALFIDDPGCWDDLMLWTMHVTPDPHRPGCWRMFYTGLSRRDQGLKQRIGMATSNDLYRWKKAPVNWTDGRGRTDPELIKKARASLPYGRASRTRSTNDPQSCFPLEADPDHYEADLHGERGWISFRDPFYFREGDQGWLLAAARTNNGPLVRRGCVALMEEVEPNSFQIQRPLFAPQLYDDIEVPNLIKLDGAYYLIGSLREDAKIRYWHTDDIEKPWRNHHDNVLLAKGNYAGRVCRDDRGVLLWNFFTRELEDRCVNNIMPPPKRLERRDDGELLVKTFEAFDNRVTGRIDTRCVRTLKHHREETCLSDNGSLHLVSEAGFQAFVFEHRLNSFRIHARLALSGSGKCGLLCRTDPQTHDGYYISLDLAKGIAQFRSWSTGPPGSGEQMMQFNSLQAGFWHSQNCTDVVIQLLSFGSYHELSIGGAVVLSLADGQFEEGLLGIYVETAALRVSNLLVEELEPPEQTDEHLTTGGHRS
ncbi:MAG: glycosyl hydrolase [Planctomycetaceae bacterium]